MPVVPSYNAPQVREQAIPNARVNTNAPLEAFGGGQVVESQQRATQGFAEVVKREVEKANQIAVTEADARASQLKSSTFYDPKAGAITKRGKDAFASMEEYQTKYSEELVKIEESLNGEQKSLFRARAAAHKADLSTQLQRHAYTEGESYDNEVTNSRLAVAREEAVLGYQDPGVIQRQIAIQERTLVEFASRSGKPPEWLQQKTLEAKSETNAAVLTRMINNGQDQLASEYFAKNKDQFTGTDSVKMEKILEEGTIRGQSQRKTDEIMAQGLSMTQAMEQVRQIEDPKLRDETSRRVREDFAIRKAAKEDAQTKMFESAANVIEKSGGNRDQIPIQVWNSLDLSQRNAIDARARQLKEGVSPVTDWQEYYDLKSLASNDTTRNEFLKTNLLQYRPKMADGEFKELVNLQTSLRKGDDTAAKEFQSNQDIANGALREIGINPTPKPGSPDAKSVVQFRKTFGDQIKIFQQRQGRVPTNDEAQSIVDNMIIKGKVKDSGYFWDDTKRAYELAPGEMIDIDPTEIPVRERAQIEASLRKRNIPVNDENVAKTYSLSLSKKMSK